MSPTATKSSSSIALKNRTVRDLRTIYGPYDVQTEIRNRQSSVQGTTLTPPILAAEKGTNQGEAEEILTLLRRPRSTTRKAPRRRKYLTVSRGRHLLDGPPRLLALHVRPPCPPPMPAPHSSKGVPRTPRWPLWMPGRPLMAYDSPLPVGWLGPEGVGRLDAPHGRPEASPQDLPDWTSSRPL